VQKTRTLRRDQSYENFFQKEVSTEKLPKNTYFVKKGFCLLTKKMPASESINKINIYLRKAAEEGHMFARFEEYIARLLFEVPMPAREFPTPVKLYLPRTETLSEQVLQFQQPQHDKLPYVNPETIKTLFKVLSVDNVLLLFKRVLLDTSNLFKSKEVRLLVNCCEAIKSLIFPLKYEVVYVPHLPEIMLDRVDAPFIFMLGIESKLYTKAVNHIKDGTYIVDLDNDHIF